MHGCLDRLPTEQRETLWIQRSRLQEEPSLDETVLGGQREGSLDDLTAQGQGATSMPARWTTADIPDQTGRTLLITGANAGIGYHQARELAAKGATVLLASRDLKRGRAARDRIMAIAPGARVEVLALDLADLDSVQRLADQVLIRDEGLDVLVNNAGVMGVPDQQSTAQGIELQFGTNHLGHFALTGRLLPALLHRPGSRVVTVSSVMHRLGRLDLGDLNSQRRYRRWQAYNNSKLANALFGLELDRRLRAAGAVTASVGTHPGYSRTGLQVTGPRLGGGNVPAAVEFMTRLFGQSAAQGGAGAQDDGIRHAGRGPGTPMCNQLRGLCGGSRHVVRSATTGGPARLHVYLGLRAAPPTPPPSNQATPTGLARPPGRTAGRLR
jgi:NAD(P)-dependent dehydrogenase (short-subunit alcohol dehydrogenase family)